MHEPRPPPIQPVDGGLLTFDRAAGRYLLVRGPSLADQRVQAPRSIQVGLLTPCNLRCAFCYRDTAAASRLSADFLVGLLQDAARWGVLEVSFGGGEPLLFPGLAAMLRELHRTTALGLNLTTNGVLLSDARLAELADVVGQIRVSAYADNHYRETLRRTRSLRTGLNLLVTPANVDRVEALVVDALGCGADDVLLLGYKGSDPALLLGAAARERLREALQRLQGLPIGLDICLYPHFSELPHLFLRHDCGAGDDFLVITPDRAVQACSFGAARIPFSTFDELQAIYARLRAARPAAEVGGCTRACFSGQAPAPPVVDTMWQWSARAANNSGDFTLIGEFTDASTARAAAAELRQLYAEIHDYFHAWNREHGVDARTFWAANAEHRGPPDGVPPPVAAFVARHHLGLDEYDHGITDSTDLPTIVALGCHLLIFHRYNLSLDLDLLEAFYHRTSGSDLTPAIYRYDGDFRLSVRARGHDPAVVDALGELFTGPRRWSPPPWMTGAVSDPRLPEGVTFDVELLWAFAPRWEIDLDDAGVRFEISVTGDMPACAALLETWLRRHGYDDVEITVAQETDEVDPQGP